MFSAALLLAVLYPILMPSGIWVATGESTGFTGPQGATSFPRTADFWPNRALLLGAFSLMIAWVWTGKLAAASPNEVVRNIAQWVQWIAVAGAVASSGFVVVTVLFEGAVVFAAAITGASILIIVFAGVFTGLYLGVFSNAGAGAGALGFGSVAAGLVADASVIAGTVIASVAVGLLISTAAVAEKLIKKNQLWRAQAMILLPMFALLLVTFAPSDWSNTTVEVRHSILFVGVLPVINGLFDFLSYAATLTLITYGLRRGAGAVALGVLDLALAAALFVGLGVSLVLALAGMAALAGAPVVDLRPLFAELRVNPTQEWWVIAMVFSTLLPTGLHALLALFAIQGIVPRGWREGAARRLESSAGDAAKTLGAIFCLAAVLTGPALLMIGAFWGVWQLAGPVVSSYATWYLDQMLILAVYTGAI